MDPFLPTPEEILRQKLRLRIQASPLKQITRIKKSGTTPVLEKPPAILVRCYSIAEREEFKDAADAADMSLQAFCHEALRQALSRRKDERTRSFGRESA